MQIPQIKDERIKELFRKSIHFCTALVVLFLPNYRFIVVAAVTVAALLYSITEWMRLRGKTIPVITAITKTAARKRDENRFVLGPITLCLGVIGAVVLLDTRAATMGIFALAFGDGIASLAGKILGKHKIPHANGKTWEGSSACFIAVLIAAMHVMQKPTDALCIALVAACIEVFPLMDFDNLIIPLAIGLLSMAFK